MSENKPNGEQETGVTHQPVDTVILTYNRATDKLEIGGHAASYDLTLDMLGRARRAVEYLVRKQQALEIQAAALEQAENFRVAAALTKRG